MDERRLVDRCLAGEEEAWGELVREYTPVVEGAVRSVFSAVGFSRIDPNEVNELTTDLFSRLVEGDFRRLRSFQWECSLSTWLYQSASRLARNHLRSRGRERKRWEKLVQTVREKQGQETPLERLSRADQAELLHQGLSSLSEEDRRLLIDTYLKRISYADLAKTRSLPPGTLASRILYAKRKLLSFLKDKFPLFLL